MRYYEKLMAKPDALKAVMIDKNGNALLKHANGTIELNLAENDAVRNIGRIEGDCFFCERSQAKHLHRKSKSYGFNYYLLKKSAFKWVMLLEDGETQYKIPKETILSIGKVLHFKNTQDGDSFELQLFLSRDIIVGYKIGK